MFKLLLKKQLYESFKGIFIDAKNGKRKPKSKIILMIVLFIFIFFSLGFSFFGMSMMALPIIGGELAWLYYALFGIVSIVLGIFVDAFSASAYVFRAKDNDLLLSMPIKPKDILASRITVLYIYAFVYSGCCWLPICLNTWINGASLISIIYDILLLFFISLFITALSCIVGYVFAQISKKARNKSLITILSSLLILGVYYYTSFKLQSAFESFVLNAGTNAKDIKLYAVLFYFLGKGATGDTINFLIFVLISIVIFLVVYVVLSKKFIKISTTSGKNQRVSKAVKYEKQSGSKRALLKREFKHFFSSPAYVINTTFGALISICLAFFVLIKSSQVDEYLELINLLSSDIYRLIPILVVSSIVTILGVDFVSAPSISLEGKSLWILKSLPINAYDVLESKERVHVLINGIPGIISTIIVGLCLKFDLAFIIYSVVCVLLFVELHALVGLVFGVLRPNFNWTTEAQPIKQSLNGVFVMLVAIISSVAFVAGAYFSRNVLSLENYIYTSIIVLMIIIIYLRRWLRLKGVEIFNKL